MGVWKSVHVCLFLFGFVSSKISTNLKDLRFYYYPALDDKIEISLNNEQSLIDAEIKNNTKLIVVVSGFTANFTGFVPERAVTEYLKQGGPNNNTVVVVDWERLSGATEKFTSNTELLLAYILAVGNVGPIGKRLAEFIIFVRRHTKIEPEDVILVGHSLGAHICGKAGRTFSKLNDGTKLSRIIGLDPAGPYFPVSANPLTKGDASFVDIYKSNAGIMGTGNDFGHANIYINGGSIQPGCRTEDTTGFPGSCSHEYSWKFFFAQLSNPVIACPCGFPLQSCMCRGCKYGCSDGIKVGPNIPQTAKGKYYVSYGIIL